jgi:hypothetical protein
MHGKNIFSEYLALPKDHPKHRQLREELWLGGEEHACRYYLSIILGCDFYAVSNDEFLKAVQDYVIATTCPEAIQFCCTRLHYGFVMKFLKRQCEIGEGESGQCRISKEDQGMILLLQHPVWTDEQIRAAVKTTDKQMKRWSSFNYARVAQKAYKNRIKGWC